MEEEINEAKMIQYPLRIKKYTGDICSYRNENNTKYEAKIRSINYYTTFDNENDAIQHIKQKNIELHLPIKNLLYRYDDYYECLLPNEKRMKFDLKDLDLVEKYVIYESTDYPVLRIKGKVVKFIHLLFDKVEDQKKLFIYHNNDKMDCRRSNIMVQRREVYLVNQNKERGVTKRQSILRNGTIQCRYIAQWKDLHTGKKCSRSFAYTHGNTKEEEEAKFNAIEYRNKVLLL